MSLLFVGSKTLGARVLELLIARNAPLAAVVARWDDPDPDSAFRSVTDVAQAHGLPCHRPKNINDPAFVDTVRALNPDVMLTAFYPKLYKRPLLEIPPRGSVNLHFAPLPRYRGSFPGAWAIINGEPHHGVTLHFMAPGCDNGPVIDQKTVPIADDDTGESLYRKCEDAGVALVDTWSPALWDGPLPATPQDESQALYHDRNFPYGGVVNFAWTPRQVYDFVRAMRFGDFPAVFTHFNRRRLYLLDCEATAETTDAPTGTVLACDPDGCTVACAGGAVRLLTVRDNRNRPVSLTEAYDRYGLRPGAWLGR